MLLALLGVFGDEHGSWAQSLTLLNIDSCLTLLSTSSCLGICHTENIVSLHASIEAAVAWNGCTELLSLVLGSLNTVKNAKGIIIGLLMLGLTLSISEVYSLGLRCLLSDTLGSIDSVEFVHCWGRNGLWPLRIIELLPSCKCLPRGAHRRFEQWSQTFCHCAWRTQRWMMTCTWCERPGRFHARSPGQLTGNWSFHRFIHRRSRT